MEDFNTFNESKKIVLKRAYTDKHPSITAGKEAAVRNKILEAIADGKITQEEFNNILKEYSKDSSKWIRRNTSYFNVSEDGISLSKFGKRALQQIVVNEGMAAEKETISKMGLNESRVNEEMSTSFLILMNAAIVNGLLIGQMAASGGDGGFTPIADLKAWWNKRKSDKALKSIIDKIKDDEDVVEFMKLTPAQQRGKFRSLIATKLTGDELEYLNKINRSHFKNESLVTKGQFSWMTQEPENDPNQSWCQEQEDDYYDKSKITKKNNNMENKFVFESFSRFVENLNNSLSLEDSIELNEAFKSTKLASILTGANAIPKELAKAFYNMTKLSLSEIQDIDIIEMDPTSAKKEKRESAVYFYFTTNEKPNPYSGENSYNAKNIPANTLLAITDGKNEWLEIKFQRGGTRTLGVGDRDGSVGFQKGGTQDQWRSGISSLSKVAELADRAYVMDLSILRARYSTTAKTSERSAAKSGATAFKDDKQFKAENMARYHTILADRAAKMPLDEEVKNAIDVIAQQIKDGIEEGMTGKYGDVIIGVDPKGREVKLRDASNVMQNLLDDFSRYVESTNNIEKEKASGYGGDYYETQVKNYAKSITDRIKKIEKLDYAW